MSLFCLWIVGRCLLYYYTWSGDQDLKTRAYILQYFTEEEIGKGKDYLLQRNTCWFISGMMVTGIFTYLYLTGTFQAIFTAVQNRITGFWLSGLVYCTLIIALWQLMLFPFRLYSGFFIERGMNFSNIGMTDWLIRYGKNFVIGLIIQGIGLLIIVWVIRSSGNFWPLTFSLAVTGMMVFWTLVSPHVITPLFYHQTPIPEGELKQKIMDISEKAGISVSDIFLIDESRYSNHTNAYFTGMFGKKRIVLYDTLVRTHPAGEVSAIFAHEAGHWKHDHMLKGMILFFSVLLVGSYLTKWIFPFLNADSRLFLGPVYSFGNLPFAILLTIFLYFLLSPVAAQLSQYIERQADWMSLELTSDPESCISAEIRLARENCADLLPHPYRVFWLFSHPPTSARIAMCEAWKQSRHE